MNDHDRDNLNFLMTISQEAFDDWLEQASDDDIDYALELIQQSKLKLYMDMFEVLDEIDDVSLAMDVINKIKGV